MDSFYFPSIFVPLVGILFPAFSMALFFIYVSKDEIS